MRDVLNIASSWVSEARDSYSAIRELTRRLMNIGPLPKRVILVSAGEASIFLDDAVLQFYHWLKVRSEVIFVSAACTSLHAGIFEFSRSNFESALVISLEVNKGLQQDCLNSLGIGNDSGQDGLEVVPGVGYALLNRATDGVCVEQCEILSQTRGLAGCANLVRDLKQLIEGVDQDVCPVSFEISSTWGYSLLRGLDQRSSSIVSRWLPSVEKCGRHYLSLKPLLELQRYRQLLSNNRLLIMTLGGGGRVGLLRLGSTHRSPEDMPGIGYEQQSLVEDIRGFVEAQSEKDVDKSACYQIMKTTLKYPRSCYRGRANHYFRWNLQDLDRYSCAYPAQIAPSSGNGLPQYGTGDV